MPRRFSSSSRSVSTPVKARTRAVLPWSMWPAVPTITLRMVATFIVLCQLGAQDIAVFKSAASDVRVVVQATEDGKLLEGLKQEDFVVSDEGQAQPVVYFARESEPLTLLLLLDISGSMRKHVEQISETARGALGYLAPGDRVGIMTFGARTNLHFEFFDNHAEVARQLRTAADDIDRTGYGTAINAAVIDAAKLLTIDDSKGRRAVLILTDNLGLNFQADDPLTVGYLLRADAMLSTIVVGRAIRPGPRRTGANPDFTPADVFRLAEATGGETVRASHAAASFAEMIERIRNRYTLAYHVPQGAKPGAYRQITVALSDAARKLHPKAVLLTREGYFVPE